MWFQRVKEKIKSNTDNIYLKMSKNQIIKTSLDEYLEPEKKWNKYKDILFMVCNKNKSVVKQLDTYEDIKIGHWLSNQKIKINFGEN